MMKKKAKSKTAAKKTAKKKSPGKSKKERNPTEVRKEISKMVASQATDMADAVIGEGMKGQLATVKYLFEMASIFPPAPDGEQATHEEDCLAKILLDKLSAPRTVVADGAEAGDFSKSDEAEGCTGEPANSAAAGTDLVESDESEVGAE